MGFALDMVWLMELATDRQHLINEHHRTGEESYAAKRQLKSLCGRLSAVAPFFHYWNRELRPLLL